MLTQALAHPSITSVVALTRHPIPATFASNPKVKNVLVEDFSTYTPSVLEQLSGADACIWCIGAKSTNPNTTRKVTLDYALAGVNAFSQLPKPESQNFRFVFTSGILAVREGKPIYLPYAKESRRLGGEAETKLEEFGKGHEGLDVYIMRPSGVTAKDRSLLNSLSATFAPMIRVNELAAAMIDVAVNGGGSKTWDNRDLVSRGREVLAGMK